jgi:hypothetical protein
MQSLLFWYLFSPVVREMCPLTAKSCHGFHGFHGIYEGTAKRRCFLQPPECRQRRQHHLVRLDTRMPHAYEFVKSRAAFEGAKQLPPASAAPVRCTHRVSLESCRSQAECRGTAEWRFNKRGHHNLLLSSWQVLTPPGAGQEQACQN